MSGPLLFEYEVISSVSMHTKKEKDENNNNNIKSNIIVFVERARLHKCVYAHMALYLDSNV